MGSDTPPPHPASKSAHGHKHKHQRSKQQVATNPHTPREIQTPAANLQIWRDYSLNPGAVM